MRRLHSCPDSDSQLSTTAIVLRIVERALHQPFAHEAWLQRQKIEALTEQMAAEAEHAEQIEIENARLGEVRSTCGA